MADFDKLLVVMMVVVAAIAFNYVSAEPDLLQDFCVADISAGVKVNGFVCKGYVTAEDFFFAGLAKPGQINSSVGSIGSAANVMKIPGLNALGLSMSRIDYAPGGLNPPHTHPRASEIVFVLEGELEMGFITTSNVLISKKVKQGEIFVFPKALIHYQQNNGNVPAAVIAAFNSQYPVFSPSALVVCRLAAGAGLCVGQSIAN